MIILSHSYPLRNPTLSTPTSVCRTQSNSTSPIPTQSNPITHKHILILQIFLSFQWSGEVQPAGRVRMAVWRGAVARGTTRGAVTRLAVSGRGCSGPRHLDLPPRPALVLEERYRGGCGGGGVWCGWNE